MPNESLVEQITEYERVNKYKVNIAKIWEHEWKRFNFKYGVMTGKCYLRVKIAHGRPVFLCAQLKNYHGRSITNSVENIFEDVINMLTGWKVIIPTRRKKMLDFLLKKRFMERVENDISRFFTEQATWIEHYPRGAGIIEDGSYALVKFDRDFNPSWNYVSETELKKYLEEIIGDGNFPTVEEEVLTLIENE